MRSPESATRRAAGLFAFASAVASLSSLTAPFAASITAAARSTAEIAAVWALASLADTGVVAWVSSPLLAAITRAAVTALCVSIASALSTTPEVRTIWAFTGLAHTGIVSWIALASSDLPTVADLTTSADLTTGSGWPTSSNLSTGADLPRDCPEHQSLHPVIVR